MKLGAAFLLAILGGCASAARPAPIQRPPATEVRGEADALRVEHEYRPAPMGSDVLMVSYDHPPRAYYASWCCRKGFYGKNSYGFYGYSPYRRRCD